MNSASIFKDGLTLPCGLVLPNRLVKAAMTEGLAGGDNHAHARHEHLYARWARGGIGTQITGNVLVDRRYLEAPGNIAIDGEQSEAALNGMRAMAKAAQGDGAKVIMQISHAGRQTPKIVSERPVAPSAVALEMPGRSLFPFAPPRAMTGEEVVNVITRFVHAARTAEQTGFDGVQIHAAHGYLLSQFLSPRTNRREDEWGGTMENRARLLLEIVRQTRAAVAPGFAVAVKLNSADFQKGGFSHADCLAVVDWLNAEKVDFIELSGGNYEQPQMMGMDGLDAPEHDGRLPPSTAAREAYFVEYANSVRQRAIMPVMATGGFRSKAGMETAIETGKADLIGLARTLCVEPDLPTALLNGDGETALDISNRLRLGPTRLLGRDSPISLIKTLNGCGAQGWYMAQIARMAEGKEPDLSLGLVGALGRMQNAQKTSVAAYRKNMAAV